MIFRKLRTDTPGIEGALVRPPKAPADTEEDANQSGAKVDFETIAYALGATGVESLADNSPADKPKANNDVRTQIPHPEAALVELITGEPLGDELPPVEVKPHNPALGGGGFRQR